MYLVGLQIYWEKWYTVHTITKFIFLVFLSFSLSLSLFLSLPPVYKNTVFVLPMPDNWRRTAQTCATSLWKLYTIYAHFDAVMKLKVVLITCLLCSRHTLIYSAAVIRERGLVAARPSFTKELNRMVSLLWQTDSLVWKYHYPFLGIWRGFD